MTNRKRMLIAKSITAAGWALLENRPDIETVTYDPDLPNEAYHRPAARRARHRAV